MTPPVALTIAGSDSGAGAGIQADLKSFAAFGVFGCCAITAVTAQNTAEVRAVHALPADVVLSQVEAVLDDLPVAAVKTGMLATSEIATTVADLAAAGRLPNLVVDPVLVSSTGTPLVDADVVSIYAEALLSCAAVFTPNLLEAEVLLRRSLTTLDEQRRAAADLGALTPGTVVVKGGHPASADGIDAVDVVWHEGQLHECRAARVDTPNTHGSGCSFASAIAAGLARGVGVLDAVSGAKQFVHRAIAGGAVWSLGSGHGPLDHFLWEGT